MDGRTFEAVEEKQSDLTVKLANPYRLSTTMTREKSLERYEVYLRQLIRKTGVMADFLLLENKILGCWCQ